MSIELSVNYYGDGIFEEGSNEPFLLEKDGFVISNFSIKTASFGESETDIHKKSPPELNIATNISMILHTRRETEKKANEALAKKRKKRKTVVGQIEERKKARVLSGFSIGATGLDIVSHNIFKAMNK